MQVEEMLTGYYNFRLLSDGKLYLFDFAMRLYGPVIYDLAHLVLKLYTYEVITYRRFNELQDVLLTNYRSVNRLTEDDWQALIPYIIWHGLASSLHFCRIAARRDCPHKSQQIKRQLQLAEYLLSLPPQNRCTRAKHDQSGIPSEFQKVLVKVRYSSRPARGE
jgi:Ser/Thr protein kinase RdoA (MazF antagonist)